MGTLTGFTLTSPRWRSAALLATILLVSSVSAVKMTCFDDPYNGSYSKKNGNRENGIGKHPRYVKRNGDGDYPYIQYSASDKVWYLRLRKDKTRTILYEAPTIKSNIKTPPNEGWVKSPGPGRRRLKSRAELLAERFARHCAAVARR